MQEDSHDQFRVGLAFVITSNGRHRAGTSNIKSIIEIQDNLKTLETLTYAKAFEDDINRKSFGEMLKVEISFVVLEPVIDATE